MAGDRSEILQGTLDLMVLKTLEVSRGRSMVMELRGASSRSAKRRCRSIRARFTRRWCG